MIWTILIFLLVLSVLVLAHEWGHYITAKRLGITVEEFGLGFPPFRGELLKYADNVGLNKILADLKELEVKVSSDRFKPSQYLQDMVANNKNFYN